MASSKFAETMNELGSPNWFWSGSESQIDAKITWIGSIVMERVFQIEHKDDDSFTYTAIGYKVFVYGEALIYQDTFDTMEEAAEAVTPMYEALMATKERMKEICGY